MRNDDAQQCACPRAHRRRPRPREQVLLEFDFIRLVKCNDAKTQAVFDSLLVKQEAEVAKQKEREERWKRESEARSEKLNLEEVLERVISSPNGAEVWKVKDCTLRYGYVSQRGFYPDSPTKSNQDSFFVAPNVNGNPNAALFGVFDGHGGQGHFCAQFARDNVQKFFKVRLDEGLGPARALELAFTDANTALHQSRVDDTLAGTTAICVYIENGVLTIANAGDSRAVVAFQDGPTKKLLQRPLSVDQTPFRKDERDRCKKCGARVMTWDQLEGVEPIHENWGLNLGTEIDETGDPPRIWAKHGNYPGCAFTRSIGDSVSEPLGVFAEPEMDTHHLTAADKFIVIASDGVWEFLTSQAVVDMVVQFEDPVEACKSICAESYSLWLQNEDRTDDITMIALYVDEVAAPEADEAADAVGALPAAAGGAEVRDGRRISDVGARKISNVGQNSAMQAVVDMRKGNQQRPVGSGGAEMEPRRGLFKMKKSNRKHSTIQREVTSSNVDEEPAFDVAANRVPKTEMELQHIEQAVRANFLFQHLTTSQRADIFSVMTKVSVTKEETVIVQGEAGNLFYVVESGAYEVRVAAEGQTADTGELVQSVTRGGHFGELALLYSKPRAASVVCTEGGTLWALQGQAFRTVLMKTPRKALMQLLRKVALLRPLGTMQLQRLVETLTERTYSDGETVIKQGDMGDTFYIILNGEASVSQKNIVSGKEKEVARLSNFGYFGELALLRDEPRAATVRADGECQCVLIGRDTFEEILGPLEAIMDYEKRQREHVDAAKHTEPMLMPAARKSFGVVPLSAVKVVAEVSSPDHAAEAHEHFSVVQLPGNDELMGLKTIGIAAACEDEQQSSLANERWLWGSLPERSTGTAVLPQLVATSVSQNSLHMLFSPPVWSDFSPVLDELFKPEHKTMAKEQAASFYIGCVLTGLQHLHEARVLYRALAPELLFMSESGYVQLADFRMAKRMGGTQRSYTMVGTPDFMAPEQVKGKGHGLAADVWGMGVLLHELVVGQSPFANAAAGGAGNNELDMYETIVSHTKGSLGQRLPKDISPELKDLLEKLLAPGEKERLWLLGATAHGIGAVRQHPWFKVSSRRKNAWP